MEVRVLQDGCQVGCVITSLQYCQKVCSYEISRGPKVTRNPPIPGFIPILKQRLSSHSPSASHRIVYPSLCPLLILQPFPPVPTLLSVSVKHEEEGTLCCGSPRGRGRIARYGHGAPRRRPAANLPEGPRDLGKPSLPLPRGRGSPGNRYPSDSDGATTLSQARATPRPIGPIRDRNSAAVCMQTGTRCVPGRILRAAPRRMLPYPSRDRHVD